MESAENARPVIELAMCLVRFWIHISRQNVTPQTRQTTNGSPSNNYDETQKSTPERQTVEMSNPIEQKKKTDETKSLCRSKLNWGVGHVQWWHWSPVTEGKEKTHQQNNRRQSRDKAIASWPLLFIFSVEWHSVRTKYKMTKSWLLVNKWRVLNVRCSTGWWSMHCSFICVFEFDDNGTGKAQLVSRKTFTNEDTYLSNDDIVCALCG